MSRSGCGLPDVHFAPDTCSYLGAPADFVASISLSYLGDMQFELIEPVRGPNIYSDFLRDSGPGLHHICVEADTLEDFDAALAAAAEQGATVAQQGVMPGGLRFAYLSAPQSGVPFLEIAHFSAEMRQFFDYIKQEQRLSTMSTEYQQLSALTTCRRGRTRSTSS